MLHRVLALVEAGVDLGLGVATRGAALAGDHEQHVAGIHRLALAHPALGHQARHARRDFDEALLRQDLAADDFLAREADGEEQHEREQRDDAHRPDRQRDRQAVVENDGAVQLLALLVQCRLAEEVAH